MQTKIRFHKLTAWLLTLAMLITMLPVMAVPALAASYNTAQTPTVMWSSYQSDDSMVADVGTVMFLYANGTPLVIKQGSTEGTCTVYDSSGSIVSATQLNGSAGDSYELKDIYFGKDSAIYGGFRDADYTGDTSITLESGNVVNIFGGGHDTEADGTAKVTGNTNVEIKGGTVLRDVYGGGFNSDVYGNTKVIIEQNAKVGGNEHNMTANVYGGGSGGGTIGGTTTVTVSGTVEGSVYGGAITPSSAVNGARSVTINAPAVVGKIVYTGDYNGGNTEKTTLTINGHDTAHTLTVSDGNIDSLTGAVRIYLSAENAAATMAEKLGTGWSGIVWDNSYGAVVSGAVTMPDDLGYQINASTRGLKNLKLQDNSTVLTIPQEMALDIGDGSTTGSITGAGTIEGPGTLISGLEMTQDDTVVDTDDGLTRKYYMHFLRSTSEGVSAAIEETDVTGVLQPIARDEEVVLTLTADGDHNLPADASSITVKRNNPENGSLVTLTSANYTYTRTDDKNGTLTIKAEAVTNALQIAVPGVATKTSLTIGGMYGDRLTSSWGDTGMTFRLFPGYAAPDESAGTAKVYAGGYTYGTWSFDDPQNAFTVSTLTGTTIYDTTHPGGAAAGGTTPFCITKTTS